MSEGQPSLETHVRSADRFMRDTFEWYVVAKKEFQDAIRSKGLWVLGAVFTALFVAPPAGALYFDLGLGQGVSDEFGMKLLISFVYTELATVFIPIIAMFVGFGAITKERETGSLKILLSLPHSRRDVVVGKVIGRCAVVGGPLAVGFLLTALFLVVSELAFKAQLFAQFGLYTMGLALVFVAIAVSISGAVSRGLYSIIGNFVVYLYFTFGWNTVANGIATGLRDYLGVSGALRWHITLLVKLLNPTQAYKTLANSDLGISTYSLFTGRTAESITPLKARYEMFSQKPEQMRVVCSDVLGGNATNITREAGNTTQVTGVNCAEAASGGLPIFYTDAAVFVFLLAWIGVAALLSYKTFNLADL